MNTLKKNTAGFAFPLTATTGRDGKQLIAVVLGRQTSEQPFRWATALLVQQLCGYEGLAR